jgi:hypothetical protein
MDTTLLLFFFVAAFLLTCLLVLLALSSSRPTKSWYLFFLVSCLGWLCLLAFRPQWANGITLFVIPVLWLAGTLKASSPFTLGNVSHPLNGEPRVTQEQLKGRAGTLEALRLYFFLLVMALIVFIAFAAASYRMD